MQNGPIKAGISARSTTDILLSPLPTKEKFLLFIPHSLLYLNAPSTITFNEIVIM
jgi:hypothetical protein